jgi:hypothetical protein
MPAATFLLDFALRCVDNACGWFDDRVSAAALFLSRLRTLFQPSLLVGLHARAIVPLSIQPGK